MELKVQPPQFRNFLPCMAAIQFLIPSLLLTLLPGFRTRKPGRLWLSPWVSIQFGARQDTRSKPISIQYNICIDINSHLTFLKASQLVSASQSSRVSHSQKLYIKSVLLTLTFPCLSFYLSQSALCKSNRQTHFHIRIRNCNPRLRVSIEGSFGDSVGPMSKRFECICSKELKWNWPSLILPLFLY